MQILCRYKNKNSVSVCISNADGRQGGFQYGVYMAQTYDVIATTSGIEK